MSHIELFEGNSIQFLLALAKYYLISDNASNKSIISASASPVGAFVFGNTVIMTVK